MAEHNFATQGPKAYYNPKTGACSWCHSKDDVARAKQEGFTSANYVRSEWPKQAYHRKTGDSRPVGKLENTTEQNEAAVASLGPDWGLEHVAVPEPAAKKDAAAAGPLDVNALLSLVSGMNTLQKRIEDLEEAAIAKDGELAGVRTAFESRITELEGAIK